MMQVMHDIAGIELPETLLKMQPDAGSPVVSDGKQCAELRQRCDDNLPDKSEWHTQSTPTR